MSTDSMVSYYQEMNLNPVPIALDNPAAWEAHVAKRRNLYERHLAIPLTFLQGRSVIEFGCNSGENALVLASFGANLTLVEPNGQVLPRLKALFDKFGFSAQIAALAHEEINSFESPTLYDVVVAEGFLCTLPDREAMVQKISDLLVPGGLAVFSFNDRYGTLLENVKRMILWRACELEGIGDVYGQSLDMAKRIFWEDYQKLNASRPFEAWWGDGLLNPLFDTLWSYHEIVPLIENAGCEFYSSSPVWAAVNHFSWYKNVPETVDLHARLLADWERYFPFFLTGFPPVNREQEPPPRDVIGTVADLVDRTVRYTCKFALPFSALEYPAVMEEYFASADDPVLRELNAELKDVYMAATQAELGQLLHAYRNSKRIRNLWGTPYHYICLRKSG